MSRRRYRRTVLALAEGGDRAPLPGAGLLVTIAAGASPVEAAIFSNHAAGVVVGKIGTATVTPEELLASFKRG